MPCYCYVSVSDQLGPFAFNKFDLLLFDLITFFIADKRVSESTYWTVDWLHGGWHNRH